MSFTEREYTRYRHALAGNCLTSIFQAIHGYFAVSDTLWVLYPAFYERGHSPIILYYIETQVTRCITLSIRRSTKTRRERVWLFDYLAGIKVTIGRKANRKSEIDETREIGVNERAEGGELRLHEIIEDNFLGPWPRLVLPCPLNFHVRGCGHLAATCSLTLHAYVKHHAVGGFPRPSGTEGHGSQEDHFRDLYISGSPRKVVRRAGKIAIRWRAL